MATIDLLWMPLGAGGSSVVRFSGRVYERLNALVAWRHPQALYHSALSVEVPDGRFVIELTPVPDDVLSSRGIVCQGAVGSRLLSRWRVFRYELRCWRDGVIPDLEYATEGPQRLTEDPQLARTLLDVIPSVPTPVWGRDELRAGEMWNSNSVIAWVLARSGVPVNTIAPPNGGRAPGWRAGLVVAAREDVPTRTSRLRILVDGDRDDHESDADQVERRRDLREDDEADEGGGRRQERDQQRVGRA